jgi:poly(A) polymerase
MHIPDLPPQLLAALSEAAGGQRLALVGGVVRDLLLHRHHQDPWRGLFDLDVVVEGHASDLMERLPDALRQHFGASIPLRQQTHGRFGTVEIELKLPEEFGGDWLVDLASARKEVYLEPGIHPQTTPGTIEEDLARRDFTINAMALELFNRKPYEKILLDPYGGQKDLACRKLRFLHAHSVKDDPSRVIRAARYAARLGFELDPQSISQIAQTLKDWPWLWKPGSSADDAPPALSSRLRAEMDLLIQREPWHRALILLQSWGAMAALDISLQKSSLWRRHLPWAARLQVPLILAITASAEDPLGLAVRLKLSQRQISCIESAQKLIDAMATPSTSCRTTQKPSEWCTLLEQASCSPLSVGLALVMGALPVKPILHWWYIWRYVKSPISAQQLIAQGYPPGPSLGAELSKLRLKQIDTHQY